MLIEFSMIRSSWTGALASLAWIVALLVTPRSASGVELDPPLRARCLALLREGLASDEFWPAMHAAEALTLAGQGEEVLRSLAGR